MGIQETKESRHLREGQYKRSWAAIVTQLQKYKIGVNIFSSITDCSSFQQQQWHILWYNIPWTTVRSVAVALTALLCTIVFKKNGPLTNYKFQIHNIVHARLIEALVHTITQWNHTNMLYFVIKYVIEWNEGFIIAASMSLKIEITIKVIDTKFIETGYKIYRNKINKKAK